MDLVKGEKTTWGGNYPNLYGKRTAIESLTEES
jgi:hypothetical protein